MPSQSSTQSGIAHYLKVKILIAALKLNGWLYWLGLPGY